MPRKLRMQKFHSKCFALGILFLHGLCAVTISAQSSTTHQTSAISSNSTWSNSSTSPTTAISSSADDWCSYACSIDAAVVEMTWYSEVLTQVVAIKTVLVEISDGNPFTTTSVNPLNYTQTVSACYNDFGGFTNLINDTTSVLREDYHLTGPVTLLVLQPEQWIMLMQKLSLVHGLP